MTLILWLTIFKTTHLCVINAVKSVSNRGILKTIIFYVNMLSVNICLRLDAKNNQMGSQKQAERLYIRVSDCWYLNAL